MLLVKYLSTHEANTSIIIIIIVISFFIVELFAEISFTFKSNPFVNLYINSPYGFHYTVLLWEGERG